MTGRRGRIAAGEVRMRVGSTPIYITLLVDGQLTD